MPDHREEEKFMAKTGRIDVQIQNKIEALHRKYKAGEITQKELVKLVTPLRQRLVSHSDVRVKLGGERQRASAEANKKSENNESFFNRVASSIYEICEEMDEKMKKKLKGMVDRGRLLALAGHPEGEPVTPTKAVELLGRLKKNHPEHYRKLQDRNRTPNKIMGSRGVRMDSYDPQGEMIEEGGEVDHDEYMRFYRIHKGDSGKALEAYERLHGPVSNKGVADPLQSTRDYVNSLRVPARASRIRGYVEDWRKRNRPSVKDAKHHDLRLRDRFRGR